MRKSGIGQAALLAAAALATLPMPTVEAQRTTSVERTRSAIEKPAQTTQAAVAQQPAAFEQWWRMRRGTNKQGYPDGPGWTNRHVQRMARKRRNQAKHRKACRG